MTKSVNNSFLWVLYFVLQILIFNHIDIMNTYAISLYLYILLSDHTYKPLYNIFRGFFIGFLMDIFSHTFGMHAAACVAITYVTNFIVYLRTHDKFNDTALPLNIKNLGIKNFIFIYFLLIIVHQTTFLLIDNWTNPISMQLLSKIFISTFLNFLALTSLNILNSIYNNKKQTV